MTGVRGREPRFLPMTAAELRARGWDAIDILIVTGDAYVDHPAFGPILIARYLEARGFRVGICAQPNWTSINDLTKLGRPRLFVGVSAGNLDSMLNKLTAQKKVRSLDQYSPGGRTGLRPNRASIVYSNLCRQAFPGLPIVLGGIEASLRRIAHYDYWADQVRRSILLDAKADLLVFGMGERAAYEVARRLAEGEAITTIRDVPGTAHVLGHSQQWQRLVAEPSRHVRDGRVIVLPSFEEVAADRVGFARMTRQFQLETSAHNGRPLLQAHGTQAVYFNPPAAPLSEREMNELYALPFARAPHPTYGHERVPAFETVRHSLVTMRGCFGGCSFCSITEHEGRIIQSRSQDSVLAEAHALRSTEGWSGVISDLGGPTANMYQMGCNALAIERACRRVSCVHPKICKNLRTDHGPLLRLMRALRTTPGVRRVFLASGVRYDLAERSPEFVTELARYHVGGQLSVAPEHSDARVLRLMKKPNVASFERFAELFATASGAARKEQYLIPYFITGHPGSTLADTIELARYLKARNLRPRQIQDFIPTPMSLSTAMYHTGLDPITLETVSSVRGLREKRQLKALLYWWDPTQHDLAREALRDAGRNDLIGLGPRALVPPPERVERGVMPPRAPALRRTEQGSPNVRPRGRTTLRAK